MISLRRNTFMAYVRKSNVSAKAKVFRFTRFIQSSIDDFSYIGPNSVVRNTTIGKFCSIAQGVRMGLGKHPVDHISTSPFFYSIKNPLGNNIGLENNVFEEYEKIDIGNDVWIGTSSIIVDGVNIGDGAIIGANSFVNRDVEPYTIVGGTPARFIRYRFDESIIEELQSLKWWDFSLDEIHFPAEIIEIFGKEPTIEMLKVLKKYLHEYENLNNHSNL